MWLAGLAVVAGYGCQVVAMLWLALAVAGSGCQVVGLRLVRLVRLVRLAVGLWLGWVQGLWALAYRLWLVVGQAKGRWCERY